MKMLLKLVIPVALSILPSWGIDESEEAIGPSLSVSSPVKPIEVVHQLVIHESNQKNKPSEDQSVIIKLPIVYHEDAFTDLLSTKIVTIEHILNTEKLLSDECHKYEISSQKHMDYLQKCNKEARDYFDKVLLVKECEVQKQESINLYIDFYTKDMKKMLDTGEDVFSSIDMDFLTNLAIKHSYIEYELLISKRILEATIRLQDIIFKIKIFQKEREVNLLKLHKDKKYMISQMYLRLQDQDGKVE